ncbi:MAG TPA: ABC transporter permease [Blastocatellia bacterium]|nr:ABC transporter permease [Blastocatellia bacterium]
MKRQDVTESVRMAFDTLRSHKFRSFLTVLGVVIGTVTVMVIASFISGLDKKFQDEIQVFRTNRIFIYKFDPGIRVGNLTAEERMRKSLTFEDAMAIKEQCPSITYVAPFLGPDGVAKVRYQNEELFVTRYRAPSPSTSAWRPSKWPTGGFSPRSRTRSARWSASSAATSPRNSSPT